MNKSELQEKLNLILNNTGETSQWKSGYKKGVWDSLMQARQLDDCIVDEHDAYLIMRGISNLPDKTFDIYWDSLKGKNNISDDFNLDREATDLDLERFKNGLLKHGYTVEKKTPLVVPQFVADWYEKNKEFLEYSIYSSTVNLHDKSDASEKLNEFEDWLNTSANNGYEVLTHMKYGYKVEEVPSWEIPLPGLLTSDGHIQFLTYDAAKQRYFASRRNKNFKQTYTKNELKEVPSEYHKYAVELAVAKIIKGDN